MRKDTGNSGHRSRDDEPRPLNVPPDDVLPDDVPPGKTVRPPRSFGGTFGSPG